MKGRLYNTARWQRMRAMVLAESPLCVAAGCRAVSTDVDHIDGDIEHNDRANLQALCHSCHSAKTVREDRATNPSAKPAIGHNDTGLPMGKGHPWGINE